MTAIKISKEEFDNEEYVNLHHKIHQLYVTVL